MHLSIETLRQCWFLAGPTACGKSEVAVELARLLAEGDGGRPVEIVSLDSMALYRGMDIGTAKPSAELRRLVPHHLIDILDPHEEFSLAEYVAAAATLCDDIVGRGGIPLFAGGTGLYLRGVLRGVFAGPPADWGFRRELQAVADEAGPDELHRRLQKVDPAAAEKLHPHDTRRIIRALEVEHVTGRPLSQQQRQPPLSPADRPLHVEWLSPPRRRLYERINRRVDQMFAAGLVDEVRRLLQAERPLSHTARQALGYKEVIDHLEGTGTLAECIERIKTRTRQFAKRQNTWFRNLEECRAVEITGDETPAEIARRLASTAEKRKPLDGRF